MTPDGFRIVLQILGPVGLVLDEAGIRLWMDLLEHFDDVDVATAAKQWAATSDQIPKPANIATLARAEAHRREPPWRPEPTAPRTAPAKVHLAEARAKLRPRSVRRAEDDDLTPAFRAALEQMERERRHSA